MEFLRKVLAFGGCFLANLPKPMYLQDFRRLTISINRSHSQFFDF
jgi:hypothetical protein